MSKTRSYKVNINITGTVSFTKEEVTKTIQYLNIQRSKGNWTKASELCFNGRELNEDTFDEYVATALRGHVRKAVRDGEDLDIGTLIRREARVVVTPKGKPKFYTTAIAEAA